MTFDEIVAAVIIDTTRPDMGPVLPFTTDMLTYPGGGDNRIPARVAAVTLALHSMDFFYKDIQTSMISFPVPAYILTLDTRLMPRFRSLSYLRKFDISMEQFQLNPLLQPPLYDSLGNSISPTELNLLEVLTNPNDIFDSYHAERTDVCYQVGSNIQIKSSNPLAQALVGWYAYPNLDWQHSLYSSWIADEYGQAVVDATVSSIFSTVGKQEQSRKYDDPRTGLVPMWRGLIKMNNIVAQGS